MYPHLGRTLATSDEIPMSFDAATARGTWRGTATPTTRVAVQEPTVQLPDAPIPRQALPQDCPSGHTWSFRSNSCIPFGDPYAAQKSACLSRAGFRWNDSRNACESSDPYVERKNACAIMNGRWDATRNVCQSGIGIREPTGPLMPVPQPMFDVESDSLRMANLCRERGGTPTNVGSRSQGCDMPQAIPFLPPKPPEVSVLDQTKDTNGAPSSMLPMVDRMLLMADRDVAQQPISVGIRAGASGAPGVPGTAADAPKWLVPAIIGAAMYLL